MIAIAVVASLVAYAWVMGYIGGQTQKTGNQIQIQSQSFTTGGNLILYVQNTGQGTVHLKQDGSVYVNDVLKNILSYDGNTASNGELIPVNVGKTIQLVIDCPYHAGDKIKVVTIEGTFMETKGTGNSGSTGGTGGSGQSYQVTFSLGAGGSSMSPSGTQTYASGASVPLTAIAASGYQFSGWTTTGTISFDSASSASTNAHINGAGSITANFVQIQSGQNYQVQFILGTGGASMTPTGTQSYANGASVPINAIAASGYQFSSWISTGTITFDSATSASTNAHIGSAGSITASFVATSTGQSYQVTFNLGTGGASMSPTGTQTYNGGSSVPVTATASSGYQFSAWTSTGTITFDSATSASTNAHINSDGTITANFVQTQSGQNYQVTFVLGAGGASITPTAGAHTYAAGASVQVSTTASSGYQFSGWSSTGTISFDSVSSASTNAHIGSDGTITANFAPIQTGQNYQVNFVLGAGGASMTPAAGSHTYPAGSSVAITATASSGYQFSGWTSTGTITFDSASSASTNAHIGSAGTITASFTQGSSSQKLAFTAGTSQTLLTGQPSAVITVQRQTSSGTPITSGSTQVTLTATSGTFYSDQYCTTQITSITINSPANSANAYYKASASGTPTLTASADSYTSVQTAFTINNPSSTTDLPASTHFDGQPWDQGWNYWTNPPWGVYTSTYFSAPNSVRSIQSNQGAFSSSPQDATGAKYVTVTFEFMINQYVDPTDFQLRYGVTVTNNYNDVDWHNLGVNLGDTSVYAPNVWHQFTVTIPNSPAFTTNFRFQFLSQGLSSSEAIYIDNVQITMFK